MAAEAATKLREVEPAPLVAFGAGKPFRENIAGGGRAHLDRALPFLILSRFRQEETDSLAVRLAGTSPAYVLWPAAADRDALPMITAIARKVHESQPRVLLVSLYDLPRDEALDDTDPKLERFVCRLSASDEPAAQAAVACLTEALAKLEVDLRTCKVEHIDHAWFEPGIEALVDRAPWLSHLSLGLPQNYRIPGEDGVYPQLLHELTSGIFDALLQGFQAFLAESAPPPPASHRALGRSAFIDAARQADRKLYRIASSFDFLLGVSPIDSARAFDRFKSSKFQDEPAFHYRPLTIDPDLAKRALYAIDLRRVEDPVLETLFVEKRREIDQQLTMLGSRNTSNFRLASLMLYGVVEPSLREAANEILETVGPDGAGDGVTLDAHQVRDAALALINGYRERDPGFEASVSVRSDIAAGIMVSGHKLMISIETRMPRHRLTALLHHEVSVHLLTCVNGAAQGLRIFESGLAGYEGVQEGLGVFAECAVGGLTAARLRLLAARVLVVDAMVEGAGFIEAFRLLRDDHGFSTRGAFNIVARVYRSGGFAKDAIYLRGLAEVLHLLGQGSDLTPFWLGKIAARHIPVVDELALRGLLRSPASTPAFLDDPQAQARIAAMRRVTSLSQLLN